MDGGSCIGAVVGIRFVLFARPTGLSRRLKRLTSCYTIWGWRGALSGNPSPLRVQGNQGPYLTLSTHFLFLIDLPRSNRVFRILRYYGLSISIKTEGAGPWVLLLNTLLVSDSSLFFSSHLKVLPFASLRREFRDLLHLRYYGFQGSALSLRGKVLIFFSFGWPLSDG